MVSLNNPAEIWLQPKCRKPFCPANGTTAESSRTWCEDPANGCEKCNKGPLRYIRADLFPTRTLIELEQND